MPAKGVLYSAESGGQNRSSYAYDENGTFIGDGKFEISASGATHDATTLEFQGSDVWAYAIDGTSQQIYMGANNKIATRSSTMGLRSAGYHLLAATHNGGLEIHPFTNAFYPNLIPYWLPSKTIPMVGNMAAKVVIAGDYAYASDTTNGVQVIHIAPITHLMEVDRSVEENGTQFDLNGPVIMTFNKPIIQASTNGQITIRENNVLINQHPQVDGKQLILLPDSGSWAAGAEYNITIGGSVADIYQNTLGENLADGYLEWTFRAAP